MISRPQPLAFRIDHKQSEVLHVPHLVFGANPYFFHWIETTRPAGSGGLETEDPIMGILVTPAGAEFIELALQVGHEYALAPGKKRWNNETDPLPASGWSITEDVFRTCVPQIVGFPALSVHAPT